MENDVAGNLNSLNLQKYNASKTYVAPAQSSCADKSVLIEAQKESSECLNAMGIAQVNMDKSQVSDSVKRSVEEYLANPEYIQAQVDFCDSLVQEGKNLEESIDKTDKVFQILKDKNIYQ